MTDDLTIPGPLRLLWNGAELYFGTFLAGRIILLHAGNCNDPRWYASVCGYRPKYRVYTYDTEAEARAALIAAVKEAMGS